MKKNTKYPENLYIQGLSKQENEELINIFEHEHIRDDRYDCLQYWHNWIENDRKTLLYRLTNYEFHREAFLPAISIIARICGLNKGITDSETAKKRLMIVYMLLKPVRYITKIVNVNHCTNIYYLRLFHDACDAGDWVKAIMFLLDIVGEDNFFSGGSRLNVLRIMEQAFAKHGIEIDEQEMKRLYRKVPLSFMTKARYGDILYQTPENMYKEMSQNCIFWLITDKEYNADCFNAAVNYHLNESKLSKRLNREFYVSAIKAILTDLVENYKYIRNVFEDGHTDNRVGVYDFSYRLSVLPDGPTTITRRIKEKDNVDIIALPTATKTAEKKGRRFYSGKDIGDAVYYPELNLVITYGKSNMSGTIEEIRRNLKNVPTVYMSDLYEMYNVMYDTVNLKNGLYYQSRKNSLKRVRIDDWRFAFLFYLGQRLHFGAFEQKE